MAAPQDSRARGRLGLPALVTFALILAVSAGIVGMHHLGGGGHHSLDSMSGHSTAADAGTGAPQLDGMGDLPHGAQSAEVTGAGAMLRASVADGGIVSACVTALLAGLLGLLAYTNLGWRARRYLDASVLLVRTDRPRPGRGPPRDLLAQLCVLRT